MAGNDDPHYQLVEQLKTGVAMMAYRKQDRVRRSVLFVPAINERALAKSSSLDADCLVFDLEDSVAPSQKNRARENLRALFAGARLAGQEMIIRINDLSTPHGTEDLMMALSTMPDAILLPKVSTPKQVVELANALEASDAPMALRIWAMIESPLAILNIADIALLADNPFNRLDCLVAGTNDLARETGTLAGENRQYHLPWLLQIIAAGRAFGLDVLDGVYNDFRNVTGFEAECRQAHDLGFDGKTLIHPAQIPPSNGIFAPSEEEVAKARLIMDAFSKAENQGVVQIDGVMVERLHLHMAEALIARHAQITRRN